MGASGTRHSLRPLFFGADVFAKLGHIVPRERGSISIRHAREAGIQYSKTSVMESRTHGVLDTRLRGYDGGGWSIVIYVIARSTCDEVIQLFLVVPDCFAIARNDGLGLAV
jgi:hypothetical protein